jgi:hypothetical protein
VTRVVERQHGAERARTIWALFGWPCALPRYRLIRVDGYAVIPLEDHRETWRSKRFRSWLRRCHYESTGEAASPAAIRSALDLLEARAQFDGPERAIHIRTAEHAGHIYLDLADEHRRAVEIGPDGWRVIGSPPVGFRRPTGMLSCRFRSQVVRLKPSVHSLICRAATTLS